MKLKTQENIRALELLSYLSIKLLLYHMTKSPNSEVSQYFEQLISSNNIDLVMLENILMNIYNIDFFASFRTQKLTTEYKELKTIYDTVIENTCNLYENIGVSDSPVKIFAMFVYMYRRGYLSFGNEFVYDNNMKDFANLGGLDVVRGFGVCRSISSMLTDIYRGLGYESYSLSVKATSESIKKLQHMSTVPLKASNKGSEFANVIGKITEKMPIPMANHVITMVEKNGKNYIFDPTNDVMLFRSFGNRLATFDDSNIYMINYFWQRLLFSLLGNSSIRDINIIKQMKQISLPTISNIDYKEEYLDVLKFCIDNEDVFIDFYEINKANYDMIEKISKDQNGVIRRLFPIIPKVKK